MLLEALEALEPLEQHCQVCSGRRSARLARRRQHSLVLVVTLALVVLDRQITSSSHALRMTNLDLPQIAMQGDTIELGCAFTLESGASTSVAGANESLPAVRRRATIDGADNEDGNARRAIETLYAVKWYKDEREFFRYLAQDWPHKQALPVDGAQIDVEKSGNQTVVLRNISLRTSGLYRCEVSTDAPLFETRSIERKLLVYVLPNEGPSIQVIQAAAQKRYFLGDQIELRCVSSDSKPAAQLDWVLNDSLNLTTATGSKPAFTIKHSRHISAPTSAARASLLTEQQLTSLGQDARLGRLASSLADRAQVHVTPSQRPISLTTKPIDQLVELSTSQLSFTVTTDLIQTLAEKRPANIADSARSRPILREGPSSSASHKNYLRSQLDSNDHYQPKRLGANSTPPHETRTRNLEGKLKLSLKINCVARVLHLRMSDEIRLVLINKARKPAAQEAAHSDKLRPTEGSSFSCCHKRSIEIVLLTSAATIASIGLFSSAGLAPQCALWRF